MQTLMRFFLLNIVAVILTACGGGEKTQIDTPVNISQIAIDKIAAYADNGKIAPVLEDYVNAEVAGVIEKNIDAVNQTIDALEKEDVDTKEEIQAIVNDFIISSDTTPPIITILGDNPETAILNDIYIDAGATALDERDGSIAVVATGNVDTSTLGTYLITYTATDSAENNTIQTRTVNVLPQDTMPPVITIIGNNPATVYQGDAYIDAGATAIDERDGSIAVVATGNVDTSTLGTYIIAYNATDSVGNHAIVQIRTINVIIQPDTASPVITIIGDNPVTVYQGDTYIDAGATAIDERDGNVSVTITGSVNTSTLGTYIIAYNATDSVGNSTTRLRTVNVIPPDTIPPVITLQGVNPVTVTLGHIYTDSGATAIDNKDGSIAVVATGSVDTSTLGTYFITYTAIDSSKNDAVQTRTVNVVATEDKTPPVMTMMGDNPVTVIVGDSYTDAGATAIDDRDGNVAVNITGNVDTSTVGIYTITYIATDSAENNTTQTRTVNVIEVPKVAPVADAGVDISTIQGDSFILNGSASSDDEAVVLYEWFKGTVKLGEGEVLELNATYFDVGINIVTLVVTDIDDLQDIDTVSINVLYGIKKTGQTKSFNEDGIEIEDSTLHDDGYYQKGVSHFYTRDDVNGTVLDNITGLMWQDNALVKRPWLIIDNYNICENDTSSPACSNTSGDTAITYCSDLNLSGYEDWRLPTINELQGIVYLSNRNPAIDSIFKNTALENYWSSNSVVDHHKYAWSVYFEYGDGNGYLKGFNISVRCVRDGK